MATKNTPMRTILDRIDFINSTVETMLKSIYYDMEGEEYEGIEIERFWGLLTRMFSLELGLKEKISFHVLLFLQ